MARVNPTILARMFASYARDQDTTPEEIAEAADEIQSITVTTDPDRGQKGVGTTAGMPENTQVEDEDSVVPDKADQIIDLLKQLLAKNGTDEDPIVEDPTLPKAEDEDPAMDPLNKFEKEIGKDADGPMEAESRFVDPEEINEQDDDFPDPEEMQEQDEDIEMENVPNSETYPDEEKAVKAGNDAAIRMAIDAIKPYIASLPKAQRRAAADAAVRQLRTRMGKDAKAKTNGYARIAQAKRKANDSAALSGKALGKKIMAERNCNAKK